MHSVHIFLIASTLMFGMHYVQSQYIDVDMISGYAFDDPIPLDDLYSQVFIDHYGRRSTNANANVQSGIAQHGWGNTNVQGNVQQIGRRQNNNAQSAVRQFGGNNNNVQSGVQQGGAAAPPPPPPPAHIAAYLQSRSPYRIASHLDN